MSTQTKDNRVIWIVAIVALSLIAICCCIGVLVWVGSTLESPEVKSDGDAPPTSESSDAVLSPTDIALANEEGDGGETWLVMLYQDADDALLEEDMVFDFNEAEMVGSSDKVTIVSQLDRYAGSDGFSGSGDWSTAKRFYITQDDDINTIHSEEIADLGEINMGEAETLFNFVVWAVQAYPADRYALILSNHGGGWTGGWIDPDPNFDYLTLNELDYALSSLISSLPIEKFDLIGFDACLMGLLDVYNVLEPYARFAVASEEVEPATGWAYNAFLQKLVDDPGMDGGRLASHIVETYLEQDQRILNDSARARMLQGNTRVTAQEVLDELLPYSTLTAIDLAYIPEINGALNAYAQAMTQIDQKKVAAARNYAPYFQSVFGKDSVPSFIDLAQFSRILEQEAGAGFDVSRGEGLRNALSKAILKNKAGDQTGGAQGISIYFPNSTLYTDEWGGYEVYTTENTRFMNTSLWDDFLAYHYAGVRFNRDSRTAVIPSRSSDVSGPGAGQVEIGEFSLSTHTVSENDIVSFNTNIMGSNVGYVYMQYGWLVKDVRTILVVLGMDYIRADQTREVGGVYYPDWGTSGTIAIDYEFEPRLFFIADELEENVSFVEVVASKYGADEDDILITVPGIFSFQQSGRQLYAEMKFDNVGRMVELIGYSGEIEILEDASYGENIFQLEYLGEEGAGSPYPITPLVGDTFMPFFTAYILEEDIYLNVKSNPIAFYEKPFKLFAESVVDFDIDFPYYVAVAVEDLDGNLTDAVDVDVFEVER